MSSRMPSRIWTETRRRPVISFCDVAHGIFQTILRPLAVIICLDDCSV